MGRETPSAAAAARVGVTGFGIAAVVLALAMPRPAGAQERAVVAAGDQPYLFLGAGYDDVNDKSSPAAGFLLEGAWRELFSASPAALGDTLFRLRPRAAVEFTSDGDIFAGAGLSLEVFPFSWPVFVEASFLPGTYYRNDDDYFPIQFRSQIGLGHEFDSGYTVAVTANHKSNNEWGPEKSSVETVMLRVGIPFSSF